jgi:hypothetical protein
MEMATCQCHCFEVTAANKGDMCLSSNTVATALALEPTELFLCHGNTGFFNYKPR